jgi:hypothetical protein
MFEKYVPSIILTLANKGYIKNVNASELKLSLWGAPPPPPPQSISQSAPRRREALHASIEGASSTVYHMVGRAH